VNRNNQRINKPTKSNRSKSYFIWRNMYITKYSESSELKIAQKWKYCFSEEKVSLALQPCHTHLILTICVSGTASLFQGCHDRHFNTHVNSPQQRTSSSTFQLLFSNMWSSSSVTFRNVPHCAYISGRRARSSLAFRKILYSYFTNSLIGMCFVLRQYRM